MSRAAAAALVAIVAWAILRAYLRGRPAPVAEPPIVHAAWCPTTRTGRPDDCDCTAEWIAA